MANFKLTPSQAAAYEKDGYLIVRNFISSEELHKLQEVAFSDGNMHKHAFDLNDQSGKKTKLTLWYSPGNDVYGLLTKSKRMVDAVNLLMEGDSSVCHFHSKLMQKEPKVGGAWEWHQDYGYWYKNEFLFPSQMISVMIAITDANKENGCLQVIKETHKMGRIEHGFSGEQVGASQHYVDLVLKTKELVFVELKAGDALFFHPNLLHRSEANLSDSPRWSLISVYNRSENVPYNEPSQSSTIPLTAVPDEALLEWESGDISDAANFLRKEKDEALK
ncbi:Ectoine hydroxylase-related dioxygenase, phytanoyl-CoA dioxygenase (PhyH) family [Chitinophaga rupis]|uniref:Ectoine hydroxylase-related dioxygenase, phytanoyl-CoA dioxygenase (PhyH) family n=1 Tax=Chitinophaga rupis TaxID=573321 RepID=A0A1H7VY26_9BACT|nr:phytanoyl-CoA dioxygenase family protein [Chitinophaga rupis]SEM13697.1 Ectoine hydroxylase-related dioxygenase, phytanoyl-CoA dioxygenase (PhyH) family [Chitinophaga rupis]